ncbi:alpha/beta hydrolase [Paenibacillus mucilaginosus]|uniref:Beta-ketoadipate enol-lactone hydrolase n=2 Tax=Paenibacillus mucilaginosus TaxID=61624 RepID=H6NE06_9BACL|nr:alpha/beta hydrolase [Paenibacillus mucilaginosus]AEI45220.1 beta-ketoadipate enol-lactone hydrolase [Paenibacillus mucilaginosus KNP414]AFC32959.1 beta-ketoadipate enol-lactone hydrolase [Paenibacillus mucilaginosus 3016]MCG7212891.1 alpha/beta fold hydrolase [Paenibacillus mucilaginosus]WDM26693.1 alpha/beta fold hydrolase [Paenibacillus mucilaginosus]WFA21404.1 alpha/beta hydrolase [Paenibacillus mucilaginosus]
MLHRTSFSSDIHYEWLPCASPSAPTLVMIHGAGLNSSFWFSVVPLLQARCSLLLYDLRGHGRSQDAPDTFTPDDHLLDLQRLLDRLGIRQAAFIGHEFGALLAARFAQLKPSVVDRLILISPPPAFPLSAAEEEYEGRLALAETSGMPALGERMARKLTVKHTESAVRRRITQAFVRCGASGYARWIRQILNPDGPCWDPPGKPVLLLSGEYDELCTPSAAGIMHALWDTSLFLVVPGAASLLFVDQPIYTADWIEYFMRRPKGELSVRPAAQREVQRLLRLVIRQDAAPQMSKPLLQVRCLGTFEVRLNGKLVEESWNTRHAKSLLIYLIFHPAAGREELCERLFPEVEHSKAMRNLRVYLSHFAKLLEMPAGKDPVLHVERDLIRLNGRIQCDLEDYLTDLQRAHDTHEPEDKYALCRNLLERLKGKIIPGSYDPFSLSLREQVEHGWEQLCLWAADYCLQDKQELEAAPFLQSALLYCPSDELPFYDRLITLYQRRGMQRELRKWTRKRDAALKRLPE